MGPGCQATGLRTELAAGRGWPLLACVRRPAVKLNRMTSSHFVLALAVTALALRADPLEDARNRQDRGYIRWAVTQADAAARKNPKDAAAQYRLAVTQSIRAEVALE